MSGHPNLKEISKITDNIYLSGMYPITNASEIKSLGIRYILSCTCNESIMVAKLRLLNEIENMTIVTIPYDDNIQQNLWKTNKNDVNILTFVRSNATHANLVKLLKLYENKSFIEIAYHIIDSVVSRNEKILVHCVAGVSRSASMVIYYFMKKYNMSYDRAFYLIQSKRNIINPNTSFNKQLNLYERLRDSYVPMHSENIIRDLSDR